MQALMSLILGYFMGCLNPAALVSRIKKVNLKEVGTKNLGATNTALVLGKNAGYFVLIFDMCKSFFSYKAARMLFPQLVISGLIAGFGALLGHCFPIFLHFQGGKGLASFGGLVLAHDPMLFAVLLAFGIFLAFAMDYGVYLALSAAGLFPILCLLRTGSVSVFLTAAMSGGLVIGMHWGNLRRALSGEEPVRVRTGLNKIFGKSK